VNSASLIVTPLAAELNGLPHLLRHSPPLQIEQTGSHSGCATHAPPWQTLLIVHESAGAQVSPSCCGSTAQVWLLASQKPVAQKPSSPRSRGHRRKSRSARTRPHRDRRPRPERSPNATRSRLRATWSS
jgi:hypothetical protein